MSVNKSHQKYFTSVNRNFTTLYIYIYGTRTQGTQKIKRTDSTHRGTESVAKLSLYILTTIIMIPV